MKKITLLSVSLGIALAIFLPPRDAMAQFGVTIRTKDGAALATERIKVETNVGTAQVLFVNSFVEIDNQNALRLRELTANGTNFVAMRASGLMGSDVTLTLPATAGAANQALSTDGAGNLSWNSVVLGVTATPPLASSGGTNPNVSLTGVVGVANGGTGLAVTGAAGNYLRSDGTNWTSSVILAGDLPAGSGNYIQNQFAAAQAASFWIGGVATFDGGVTHNGATTFNGTLTANGTAAFNGGVTIGSGASTAAVNTTTWDVSAAGTVTGATWNGSTVATGFGGTNVSSSGAAGNYLRSDGTNWTSSAILAADLPTGSTNYIQNQSAAAQAASFWISGTGRVFGAMTLDTTLAVSGATTLSSTLGVTGAATLSSTLSVLGASTMSSTLSVTGATTLASTLAVTGATTLSSNVTVGDGAGTDRLSFSGTSGIIQVGTFIPGAPLAGDFRYNAGSLLYYDGAVWQTLGTAGGSTPFSSITTGTNSTAIMTVNTGAQIVPLGTGIIRATEFQGAGSLSTAVDLATAETSGILPIAKGGTNSGAALAGSSIMISNGASIVQGLAGTATTVLHGNIAGAPTYSAISLTTDVTGTLPVGSGGTGSTSYAASQFLWYNGATIVASGFSNASFMAAGTDNWVNTTGDTMTGILNMGASYVQNQGSGWGFQIPFGSGSDINFRDATTNSNLQLGSSGAIRNGLLTFAGGFWYDQIGFAGVDPGVPAFDAGNVFGMYPTSTGIRWYNGAVWSTISGGGGTPFVQDGNSFGVLATLGTNDLQPLAFETFNTERMRLQTDGTVSIGTALDSVYRLDVQGGIINCGSSVYANIGAAPTPAFTFGTDNNTGMFGTGIDVIGYSTGGLERMRIDAAGNVGIGVVPSVRLQVAGGNTWTQTLEPTVTSTYTLGSAGLVWNQLYVNDIIGQQSAAGQSNTVFAIAWTTAQTVAITTASTGSAVLLNGGFNFTKVTGGGFTLIRLVRDGIELVETDTTTATLGNDYSLNLSWRDAPAVGAHTYTLQYAQNSGTLTIYGSQLQVVEVKN